MCNSFRCNCGYKYIIVKLHRSAHKHRKMVKFVGVVTGHGFFNNHTDKLCGLTSTIRNTLDMSHRLDYLAALLRKTPVLSQYYTRLLYSTWPQS